MMNKIISFVFLILIHLVNIVTNDVVLTVEIIRLQVKGASISSPYRLRPIVGIKLPLNTTFSPLIQMYNPYTEPIQVRTISFR